MKAALLVIAAAMACDFDNRGQIRTRHPDFIQLFKIIGIEIDNDCVEHILQTIEDDEECNILDDCGDLHQDKEDGIALRVQGTIASVREDCRYGYINGRTFVHYSEFHNGMRQLSLYAKAEYEAYWQRHTILVLLANYVQLLRLIREYT